MLSRLVLAAMTAILISGCQSYYPYCDSCGQNSGFQPTQIYQQPATVVPYQGQPGVPSGTVTPNGGSAPPFQPPSSSGNPSGTGGKAVPEYNDTDPGYDSGAYDSQYQIQAEEIQAKERAPVALDSIEESVAAERSVTEEPMGDDQFVDPIPFQPASATATVGEKAPSASRPNPYRYDKEADDFNGDGVEETYEWLMGVVDYDNTHRKWRITYNPDPTDKDDKYGGTFTLTNAQAIYDLGLIPDDVVLIDGRVDIKNTDRAGKPTYRVEHVERLEPDPNFAE